MVVVMVVVVVVVVGRKWEVGNGINIGIGV